MVVILVVMNKNDVILLDEFNYVLIIDGCCLFKVKIIWVNYLDMDDLCVKVKEVVELG